MILYYISSMFMFFKLFFAHFEYYFFNTTYSEKVLLLLLLIVIVYVINLRRKSPSKESVLEQIMKYRFDYDFERYYSIVIVVTAFVFYIAMILYLRILSFGKTLDLNDVITTLWLLALKQPIIVFSTTIAIIILAFYLVFILGFGIIRKYLHDEAVKLHFYYLDKPLYEHIYEKIQFKYSLSGGPYDTFLRVYWYCCYYFALGYQIHDKQKPFRIETAAESALIQNSWFFKYVNSRYFLVLLYNLHYVILLSALFYDLFFNGFTIQYTFKILPYLFLYQIYVLISKFVSEKPLTDICAYTNIYFYHHVIHVGDDSILIDGELSQVPFNFADKFLLYKVSGFTKIT